MDLSALADSVIAFVRQHQVWAGPIAGALAFCESLAFVSLLVPATVILLGIGGLIGASGLDFWPIWAGAAIGATLGDWLSYEVGLLLEDRAHHVWPLKRYPDMIAKAEAFTRRWGVWAIFLGRFFGPARAFVPLVAGIFEMPRWRFQVANVTSALLWAFVLLAPGTGLLEMLRR
jgi:membrane protein DedA with SNARE-associated domain